MDIGAPFYSDDTIEFSKDGITINGYTVNGITLILDLTIAESALEGPVDVYIDSKLFEESYVFNSAFTLISSETTLPPTTAAPTTTTTTSTTTTSTTTSTTLPEEDGDNPSDTEPDDVQCTEDDNGDNPFVPGTTSDSSGSHDDYCETAVRGTKPVRLTENYCKDGFLASHQYNCQDEVKLSCESDDKGRGYCGPEGYYDDDDDPSDTGPHTFYGEEGASPWYAYVFIGNIEGQYFPSLITASAEQAVEDFKKAGYEVIFYPKATATGVRDALENYNTKAIWLVGHGIGVDRVGVMKGKEGLVPIAGIWVDGYNGVFGDPEEASSGDIVINSDNLNQVHFHACKQKAGYAGFHWERAFPGATYRSWYIPTNGMLIYADQITTSYPRIDQITGEEISRDSGADISISNQLDGGEIEYGDSVISIPPTQGTQGSKADQRVKICSEKCEATECNLDPTQSENSVKEQGFGNQKYGFYITPEDFSEKKLLYSAAVEDGRIVKSSVSLEPQQSNFDVTMTYEAVIGALEDPHKFDDYVSEGKFQQLVFPLERSFLPNLMEVKDILNYNFETAPSPVKAIFKKERITTEITLDNGETKMIGIETADGAVLDVFDGEMTNPTMKVFTSEETIENIIESENPAEKTLDAFNNGDIRYEGVGIRKKAKVVLLRVALKLFSFFM
jgi:hypothetical protein